MGLGFGTVATLLVCIGLGLYLDQRFDLAPVCTLAGVVIGLIGAGYQLWELVRASDPKQANGPLARTMAQRMASRSHTNTRSDS